MQPTTKSVLLCSLLLALFPVTIFSQTFYEVFRSGDPDPDGLSTGGNPYSRRVTINLPWAATGSNNSYDVNGGNSTYLAGAVYIYHRDLKGRWDFYQKVVASDRGEYDNFGIEVSVTGGQLVVGANGEDDDENGNQPLTAAGSVYVFELDSNEVWQETQKLVPSDRALDDRFGQRLAIEQDVILAGNSRKPFDAGNGNVYPFVGTTYVFEKNAIGTWVESQKLNPPSFIGGERFGEAVDLSGEWAAIGAPREDEDANGQLLNDAGAVYLYQRDPLGQWNLQQVVTPSDREAYDWFGYSVAMEDSLLIVGAIWEEEDSLGQNPITGAGSAYIFRLQPNGEWQQEQKLNGYTRATVGNFGLDVAISRNLATVSYLHNPNDEQEEVSVFEYQTPHWCPKQALVVTGNSNQIGFGGSLELDGSSLISNSGLSTTYPTGEEPGHIHIFETCDLPETVLQDTTCPGTPYAFGTQLLSSPGVYFDTLQTVVGCDSLINLELTVLAPETSVTESDSTLSVMTSTGSVQWLDCSAGYAIISGATEVHFFPSQSGTYAVSVSQYGCIDTSACVAFITAGVSPELDRQLRLFPNPSQGKVHLDFAQPQVELSVQIFDLRGKLLQSLSFDAATSVSLELPEPKGLYLISIQNQAGERVVRRVEKE